MSCSGTLATHLEKDEIEKVWLSLKERLYHGKQE